MPSHAALIGVVGAGQIMPAVPPSLVAGSFESDLVSGFDEQQNVFVAADTVQVTQLVPPAGAFPGGGASSPADPFLPANIYSSHLLHFDSLTLGTINATATFFFSNPIAAVVFHPDRLIGTDTSLGLAPGATYDASANRGLGAADLFTVDNSNNSVRVRLSEFSSATFSALDNIRVITTPEPGSLVSLALLLTGGFALYRSRRRG